MLLYWLFFASAVLPLSFVTIIGWRTYQLALEDAQNLVQRTVDVLHENTLKVFETQELILDQVMLALQATEVSGSLDLEKRMKELEGRSQVASIWVLDRFGNVRASSTSATPGLNGSDRDYFQAHIVADAGTYIGRAFVGRATGQRSFGFSRRLSNQDGSFAGVASISVSSSYFSDFFHRAVPNIDHLALLIRSDGQVLARDPPDFTPLPPDDPLLRATALADGGVMWRMSHVDGLERLYAYRRVTGHPLIVSVAVPRAAILGPWLASLFFDLVVTGVIVVALAALLAFALIETRRESTALGRLSDEALRRERIEEQLRRSQKLEALGQLTGSVAHDFGNLLTPILGNLHLLRSDIHDPRAPSRVKDALTAAEMGEKLVRSLLAFARQQPLTLQTIDVNAVIIEMRSLLEQSLANRHRLVLELTPNVWPVLADAGQLELAMLNLVVNAKDAMTKAGAIRISTANVRKTRDVVELASDSVAISVSDAGEGMQPEVLARAFEPFFTTKPAGKGTGLGLASVYGFAKQCGGDAAVESEPGKGTTVTLYLPRQN